MKWSDHKRLINAATQGHRVPLPAYQGLMHGVIDPDKNPEQSLRISKSGIPYQVTEAHHRPDMDKIKKEIWQARRFWLAGEEYNTGFQLGRALHYIHDGLVGKGFLGLSHDSNESRIRYIAVNNDAVDKGLTDSKNDPLFIERLINDISPQDPEHALNRAAYITAAILKSVFGQRTVPPETETEYARAVVRHNDFIMAGMIAGLIVFAMGAFYGHYIAAALASVVISYVIIHFDERFYDLKKKREWFSSAPKTTCCCGDACCETTDNVGGG